MILRRYLRHYVYSFPILLLGIAVVSSRCMWGNRHEWIAQIFKVD